MSEAERERWEARWAARDGEPGRPEPFLLRHAGALPPGPVLDAARIFAEKSRTMLDPGMLAMTRIVEAVAEGT